MVKAMDLQGMTYGFWKILKRNGLSKSGFAIWECECKCGTKKNITSIGITHKKAKMHCGCDQDWTGKKFGRLTVLKKISGLGNHAAKILCKCDCGVEKIVWGGSLHQGTVKSCGCIKARSEEHSCFTIVMSSYHKHAKVRSLEFKLDRETFVKLALQPCFYCGTVESNTMNRKTKYQGVLSLKYNGIDRLNNDDGYLPENCVSCCKICNYMKRSLSLYEWKKHMELILNHLNMKEKQALVG